MSQICWSKICRSDHIEETRPSFFLLALSSIDFLQIAYPPAGTAAQLTRIPLLFQVQKLQFNLNHHKNGEIYTVGTSSWKTVTAQGKVPSSWLQTANEEQSIYFKGCIYNLSSSELISFDLSKEVFESVELPEYDNSVPTYFGDSLALVDRWSSLAVLHFSTHVVSLWVLDDNAAAAVSSWTLRCTFAMAGNQFLYLKKNGDLFFNGDRLQILSYNIHTEEEKILAIFPKDTFHILGYKESLVLLN